MRKTLLIGFMLAGVVGATETMAAGELLQVETPVELIISFMDSTIFRLMSGVMILVGIITCIVRQEVVAIAPALAGIGLMFFGSEIVSAVVGIEPVVQITDQQEEDSDDSEDKSTAEVEAQPQLSTSVCLETLQQGDMILNTLSNREVTVSSITKYFVTGTNVYGEQDVVPVTHVQCMKDEMEETGSDSFARN